MLHWIKKILSLYRKYIIGFDVSKVFTTSVARVNYVQRKEIEKTLIEHIQNEGRQIIIYGHSGGGKTTIIEKIRKEKKLRFIESICVESTSIDQLIISAFDKLNSYFVHEVSDKQSGTLVSKMKSKYLNSIENEISAEVSLENQINSKRIANIQMTAERLAEFIGKNRLIWLIDDFHKLEESQKKHFSQMLKVFSTQAKRYPKLKIICIGAERTAREVIDYDHEMKDRVAEVHIPLLNNEQIKRIITNGFDLLNASIKTNIVDEIVEYSNNVGTIAHNLCYQIALEAGIQKTTWKRKRITNNDLESAIRKYLLFKEDSFKQTLDRARRQRKGNYKNADLILSAFISLGDGEFSYSELLTEIQKTHSGYPSGNLTSYLKKLSSSTCDEIILFDEDSGKFSIRDPFLFAYIQMIFYQEANSNTSQTPSEFKTHKLSDDFIDAIVGSLIN